MVPYSTRKKSTRVQTHLGTPFHTDSSLRRDCDWALPCQCVDCREEAEQRENERRETARVPICQVCEISPTAHVSYGAPVRAIGRTGYTSFCAECWRKATEKNKEIVERRERKEQQSMKSIKGMVESMFQRVRAVESTEQIPIAYAVDKDVRTAKISKSRQWCQTSVISNLREDLEIVEVRNRWMCSKQRADAMDFRMFVKWGHSRHME